LISFIVVSSVIVSLVSTSSRNESNSFSSV
jgi:hypothetical protein